LMETQRSQGKEILVTSRTMGHEVGPRKTEKATSSTWTGGTRSMDYTKNGRRI
ncbi:hypothetical protein M433DRAFT_159139, partial [Acidomyces richmondensis BFW]